MVISRYLGWAWGVIMLDFLITVFSVVCILGGVFLLPLILCWRSFLVDTDAPGGGHPGRSGRAHRSRTDGTRGRSIFSPRRRPCEGECEMSGGNGMLVLSRRIDQQIVIGDDTTVTVLGIHAGAVKLGINAPRETKVDRLEVRQRQHGDYRNVG
jgi:carbon storage regulator